MINVKNIHIQVYVLGQSILFVEVVWGHFFYIIKKCTGK